MRKTVYIENMGTVIVDGGEEGVLKTIAHLQATAPSATSIKPLEMPRMEFSSENKKPAAGDPSYGAGLDENPFPPISEEEPTANGGRQPVLNIPSMFPEKKLVANRGVQAALELPSLFPAKQ